MIGKENHLLYLCDRNTAIIQKVLDELAVYNLLSTTEEKERCLWLCVGFFEEFTEGTDFEFQKPRIWMTSAWSRIMLVLLEEQKFAQVQNEISHALEIALDRLLEYRYQNKNGDKAA